MNLENINDIYGGGMDNNRDRTVDILCGFGIIIMIWGHVGLGFEGGVKYSEYGIHPFICLCFMSSAAIFSCERRRMP